MLSIYEAPTVAVGTPVTPLNRNRNSTATATATVVHTPTVTGTGTLLEAWDLSDANNTMGDTRGEEEWELKAGTAYLVRCASGSAGNKLTLNLDFYEHEEEL